MLRWALIFLVVAIIAEIFGFSGAAGEAARRSGTAEQGMTTYAFASRSFKKSIDFTSLGSAPLSSAR